MGRQIELALLSLMPSWGSDLPSALVDLAESLMAQSQHRASTLKADEEIARHYACANIACDRLKVALDLPPIQARPPVPPRIYRRLYMHLDNVLPRQSAAQRSSRRRVSMENGAGSSSAGSGPLPSRLTPTKDASLAPFRPNKEPKAAARRHALHPWIPPVLRFLCAETDSRRFMPTMLAGVECIVTPGGRMTQDAWTKTHVSQVVAAVYFYVMMRVRALSTKEWLDRSGYVPLRKTILGLMKQARTQVQIKQVDEAQAWRDWQAIKPTDFDEAVAHVKDQDWLLSDWYEAIAHVAQDGGHGEAEAAEARQEAALIPERRADTMLQEKYDYISEARRREYRQWRESMLSQIGQGMTVDSPAAA
ncbi:hypothetical protein CDD82_3656 [Ophiocordyceps australis]|uniref:ORC6 first cyclin-like domain-containing protein n=1 Tax=Ophiocordyceps australis TaxID=1399860 RepID=A0A2C5ZAT5_9HYPO|nr:hypothetical protein CDD82_3656 [Ophiocordyceps australis]